MVVENGPHVRRPANESVDRSRTSQRHQRVDSRDIGLADLVNREESGVRLVSLYATVCRDLCVLVAAKGQEKGNVASRDSATICDDVSRQCPGNARRKQTLATTRK